MIKALFILGLLVASCSCISLTSLAQVNSKLAEELQEMQDTSLGQMLISLVEVHLETGGPVDELFAEVENLKKDLQIKFEVETEDFRKKTNAHNDEVQELKAKIGKAQFDITSTTTKLETILKPKLVQLNDERAQLISFIQKMELEIFTGDNKRKVDHQSYLERQDDHNNAKDALKEAIGFVESLRTPSASFIQVRQARKSLQALQTNPLLKKNIYSPLISALISLSKNFSDQSTVQKIVDLLQKVLQNVIESSNNETNAENKAATDWVAARAKLVIDIATNRSTLASVELQIKETIQAIKDNEAFLAQRKSDLIDLQAKLKSENDKYDKETSIHNKIVQELTNEGETLAAASKILDEAKDKLTGYIQGVMNK